MRDPQNEVTCPDCGTTHYDYPRRACRDCRSDAAATRADQRRAWKEDR